MIEVNYTRPRDPAIDRNVVAKTTDVGQLREWYADLDVLAQEISEVIKASTLAGQDASRAGHKLGFVRIAQTWVTRRLKALTGEMSPEELTQIERLRLEVTRLHQQNDDLRFQNGLLREARDVQKLMLVVHAAGDRVVVTERHALNLPSLRLSRTEDAATGDVTFSTEFAE